MDASTPPPRALIGKLVLAGAAIMALLAVAFWLGWLPIADDVRPYVAGALLLAAAVDVFVAFRFLGESK